MIQEPYQIRLVLVHTSTVFVFGGLWTPRMQHQEFCRRTFELIILRFNQLFGKANPIRRLKFRKIQITQLKKKQKETTRLVQGACHSPEQRPIEDCDLREKPQIQLQRPQSEGRKLFNQGKRKTRERVRKVYVGFGFGQSQFLGELIRTSDLMIFFFIYKQKVLILIIIKDEFESHYCYLIMRLSSLILLSVIISFDVD